jgi:hypothetical protein
LTFGWLLLCACIACAEPPAAINPLQDLPSDVQAKMARLSDILSEAIRNGRLSDSQLQSAVYSGNAPELIRGLGPEAAQLLQDISEGFKGKYTEQELGMILGGLLGAR